MADFVRDTYVSSAFNIPVVDQAPPISVYPTPSTPSPAIINYIQRVYSSGLSDWCYYTQTVINPAPLSGDTSPNWTGSITAHEVLATVPE